MQRASHWKYHTFERYNTRSCSRLTHKAHQKVRKCGLTFPLKNRIVTFYENCTNKYDRVDKLRGVVSAPSGFLGYFRYNVLMAWANVTTYTSKRVHMDPKQLPEMLTFGLQRGWYPTRKVFSISHFLHLE